MLEMILVVSVIMVMYFAPIIVAKDKPIFMRVIFVNLLLGWTIVGWLVALVMAVGSDDDSETQRPEPQRKPSRKKR